MKQKMNNKELIKSIEEAKKDPEFIKEIERVIKISSSAYDLKQFS